MRLTTFTTLTAAALRSPAVLPARPFALGRHAAVAPRMAFSLPRFNRGQPEPQGPSEEVQGLYRMLGLAEDADYDEINASYERLAEKYTGQTKRLIKLQVAKDKILEDRLRQRMSGSLKGSITQRTPDDRPTAKQPLIRLPSWLDGIPTPRKQPKSLFTHSPRAPDLG